VSEQEQSRKHALECLRQESDCLQLAGEVHNYHLQSHFVRMARFWFALAVSGPSENAGHALAAGKTHTT
jgi:hypothetical protein